jgi:hypothetical protein
MNPRKRFLFLLSVLALMLFLPALVRADANPNPITLHMDVEWLRITTDGQTVFYGGYLAGTSGMIVRYDVATGERTTLASAGNTVPFFSLSRDESLIAYEETSGNGGHINLVPTTGGTPVRLVSNAQVVGYPYSYGFTADTQYVIFVDEGFADENVYAAPVDGGAFIELTAGLPDGIVRGYTASPVGSAVVFLYETAERDMLVLAPLDGNPTIVLNPPGIGAHEYEVAFAPDGNSLFFVGSGYVRRAAVPDGTLTTIGDSGTVIEKFLFSPDGQYMFYDWRATNQPEQVYRLTLSDNSLVALTNHSGGFVSLAPAASADHVVYHVVPFSGSPTSTMYSVGYDPIETPVELATAGTYPLMEISSDGTRVVYETKPFPNPTGSIYSVPIDGSATPTVIYPNSDGHAFKIAPNGSLVYVTKYIRDVSYGLYGVPIEGGTITPYFERNQGGTLRMWNFVNDNELLFVDQSTSDLQYDTLYRMNPNLPILTPTPTVTRTPSPTRTPTLTLTVPTLPTSTATRTATLIPTNTATASATMPPPTLTPTASPTGSVPPTLTATASVTPSPTATMTATKVPATVTTTPVATHTPTATATAKVATPTVPSATSTATTVPSVTVTKPPIPSTTPSATVVSTATATTLPSSTTTPSPTPPTSSQWLYLPLIRIE